MAKTLVFGNWKMHGSRQFCDDLVAAIKSASANAAVQVGVFPTALHLERVAGQLEGTSVAVGAQNFYPGEQGAFTGEIAAPMLTDIGVSYVLAGHSERREIFQENDELVARKFVAAQQFGLTPVLCIGESLEERESGVTEDRVASQLDAVLGLAGIAAFSRAIIAYEPVWAIGTGKTATPGQAQDVHSFIRNHLARQDEAIATDVAILYGGSVKSSNAGELFSQPDINGGLVGGASLVAEEFISICQSAE